MKKYILSLVIMSLGVIMTAWTVHTGLSGITANGSEIFLVLLLLDMLLGPASIIYGAITAFKEAKK